MMLGFKPSGRIWKKVNKAILGENAGEAISTIINGLSMLLVQAGVARDELDGRVHLAAMLLSPDSGPVGGLADRLPEHFAALSTQGKKGEA
jgi:hypothetical protein